MVEDRTSEDPAKVASRPAAWAPTLLACVALVGAVFASRVPFLADGYGEDSDAWLVVTTAREIARTGRYQVSRFPGYPLQEMAYACIAQAGPTVMNGVTAAWSGLAALFFYLSARKLGCRLPWLVSLGFAFVPVVYIASTTTMDYVWALAFVLAALYFALGRRPVVAGVLLGAAISCRITSGAMIVPLGIILAMSGERRWDVRASLMFVVTTLVVGGLLFSPVLYRYHFDFFTHYGATPRWHKVPRLATDRVWGRLGWVAVAAGSVIALWLAVRRRDRTWSALPRRTQASLGACLVAIVLYVVAFLKLPVEAGYLIPVVPFVLFPLARLLPRPVLAAICVALLISPFMAVGRHGFARGEVLVERTKRCAEMEVVQSYCHTVNRLEPKSVTIVGYQFHWVEGMGLATDAQRRYVYSLGPVEAATYRAQGYRLYYTPPGRAEVLGGGGDVDRYGAWPLPGTEEGSDRRRL